MSSPKHNSSFIKKLLFIPKILTKKESRIIQVLSLLILISLTLIGVSWYKKISTVEPAIGGEYIEGIIGTPKLINPILAQTNEVDEAIARLIFSGLLKQNDNTLIPDLAKSYTVSADGLTYTFTLREDAFWHDSTPFSAEDVIFTIHAIQNPEYKSPLYNSLAGVQVLKINDYSVSFTLSQPFAPFPSLLTFGILPQHLFENIPAATAHLADFNLKRPIGTGPYKIKSFTKDSRGVIKSYTLAKNETFYTHPPYIKEITFKFYPDFNTTIEALNNNNIDGISFLPNKYHSLVANKHIKIFPLSLPQYTAIFFNTEHSKPLQSISVRKALTHALHKQNLVAKVLDNQGEVIYGPILPGFIGYNPQIIKYEYAPDQTQKLLSEDGWKKTSGAEYAAWKTKKKVENQPSQLSQETSPEQLFFWQKDDDILTVTLTTVDNPETRAAATLIKQFWQDSGFLVQLRIISASEIVNDVLKTRNYEALLFGQIIGNDPDPYAFWHSSQREHPGVNLALYKNEKVDTLLEEARKITDPGERAKKYIEFQDILKNDEPSIFLYNPTYPYLIHKKIKGFAAARIAAPADRFNEIEKWYIKTKRTLTK